jgi:GxxExxY protein
MREGYGISYKEAILLHFYYADFVVWDKILLEAKAVESLTDSHVKQVLNYIWPPRNFGSGYW